MSRRCPSYRQAVMSMSRYTHETHVWTTDPGPTFSSTGLYNKWRLPCIISWQMGHNPGPIALWSPPDCLQLTIYSTKSAPLVTSRAAGPFFRSMAGFVQSGSCFAGVDEAGSRKQARRLPLEAALVLA